MHQDHVQKTLDGILAQAGVRGTEYLTDETEDEFVQDIAADLEVFIQLAKVGHYDRAMPFFDEYLRRHSMLFPVAAEYAEALLEQGAFGQAEQFLAEVLDSELRHGILSGMEKTIMELLFELAKMHTLLECKRAVSLAERVLRDLGQERGSVVSDEELQAMVLCLRIWGEAVQEPISTPADYLEFSFFSTLRLRRILGDGSVEDRCKTFIQQLGASGYVWQAQKLQATMLQETRYTRSLTWDTVNSMISSTGSADGAPAVLAGLTMVGDYSQYLLANHSQSEYRSSGSMISYIESLPLLTQGAATKFLSTIDTNIEETRQLKYARYSIKCIQRAPVDAHGFVEKDRHDYAMTFLAQLNLARFEKFGDLDLEYTQKLLADNCDKLGWLRLLAVLRPFSATAKQIVSAWKSFEWTDVALIAKIDDELQSQPWFRTLLPKLRNEDDTAKINDEPQPTPWLRALSPTLRDEDDTAKINDEPRPKPWFRALSLKPRDEDDMAKQSFASMDIRKVFDNVRAIVTRSTKSRIPDKQTLMKRYDAERESTHDAIL